MRRQLGSSTSPSLRLAFVPASPGEAILTDPMAVLRLARVQEELGRLEEGGANYEWFALAWRDADPTMRGLAEEAPAAAIRLAGP